MDQPVRPNRFLDRTLLPMTGFPLKLQEHKRLPATFKSSLADILRWHNLPTENITDFDTLGVAQI